MNEVMGKRISELRKSRNMTQHDFAAVIGMSTSSIAMWEIGKRDPDSAMILKIAAAFGVTTDYILGNSKEVTNPMQIQKVEKKLEAMKKKAVNCDLPQSEYVAGYMSAIEVIQKFIEENKK